jgi:ribosomal protein S12 methylthiotransferase
MERSHGEQSGSPIAVMLVNLGCPKNQVDAEVMLGQLAANGYAIVESAEAADVVLVNTCGFIQEAKEESIDAVLQAAALKRTGKCRSLIVSGCLPQRYHRELAGLLPEVDGFVGTGEFPRIAQIVRATLGGAEGNRAWVTGHTALMTADLPRRRLSPPHVAYLKLAEGCNHTCRFCAIPAIRGPLQSRPRDDVTAEARRLAAEGVRELILVSQDTTSYGADRGEPRALVPLLRDLLAIPSLAWIRLHYLYPTRIGPDLIELLAAEPRLCRYVDLPLQHADGRILKAMGRGGNAASLERLIARLRRAIPDAVIRTAFITGFPGETRAAFAVLRRFVEAMRFERLGVFRYSDEEGTAAARLTPKVSRRVAEARRARLMAIQARIVEEQGRNLIGSVQDVLIDGPVPETPGIWCGRTAGHAPEVDGTVFVRGGGLLPGTMVRARIQAAVEHDLVADLAEEPRISWRDGGR